MSHPHAAKAPHSHGHPAGTGGEKKYLPRLIAWEVTRSCVLNCVHCRAAAKYGPYPGELSTEEAFAFLDDVKSFSDPIIILTGGEPMMRKDIYDIAKHGTSRA
jgi:MoaA/NifB/PqqE/SkfB family radical SAM enzyme